MDFEETDPFKERFPSIVSLEELNQIEFPPIEWLIPGLLPIGSTLLAGPPKIGKSYFLLNLIKKVMEKGKGIFYYAGEDDIRRLKRRLQQLEIDQGLAKFLPGRTSTINEDVYTMVEDLLLFEKDIKAVFIDTMQLVLPRTLRSRDYEAYVHDLKPWSDLAQQKSVSIVMAHHTRKEGADVDRYPHDSILGSQGIMASFDNVMTMRRTSDGKGGVLNVIGKDIEQQEYRLSKKEYGWEMEGLESIASLGEKQTEVLKCIEENKGITPKELSEKLEMDAGNLSRRITKLVSNNLIVKEGLGYSASS